MADPVSLGLGVIGIAGIVLHGARRVKELVDGVQGASKVVTHLSKDAEDLSRALEGLICLLRSPQLQSDVDDLNIVSLLDAPLNNCINTLQEIELKIRPFIRSSREATTGKWRSLTWTFRENDVRALRGRLSTHVSTLEFAISITALFGNMQDKLRGLYRRLDIDQKSLADSTFAGSLDISSDYGYGLRRFLLESESVAGGSPPKSPELEGYPPTTFMDQSDVVEMPPLTPSPVTPEKPLPVIPVATQAPSTPDLHDDVVPSRVISRQALRIKPAPFSVGGDDRQVLMANNFQPTSAENDRMTAVIPRPRPINPEPPPTPVESTDILALETVDEAESQIRGIERRLYAERQLTATLEEALIEIDKKSNRDRAEVERWKRKVWALEEDKRHESRRIA